MAELRIWPKAEVDEWIATYNPKRAEVPDPR